MCRSSICKFFNPLAIFDHLTLIPTHGSSTTISGPARTPDQPAWPGHYPSPSAHLRSWSSSDPSWAREQPRSIGCRNSLAAQAAAPPFIAQGQPHWSPRPTHQAVTSPWTAHSGLRQGFGPGRLGPGPDSDKPGMPTALTTAGFYGNCRKVLGKRTIVQDPAETGSGASA